MPSIFASRIRSSLLRAVAASALAAAAASPAAAAFVYSLDVQNTTFGDFVLTVPNLIAGDTTFQLTDFDSINPLPGTLDVKFEDPMVAAPGTHAIWFEVVGGGSGHWWAMPFSSPGVYCAGGFGCNNTSAIMTIREAGVAVPEPGALLLVATALAALGAVARRRRMPKAG